jgi:hypothetical protein
MLLVYKRDSFVGAGTPTSRARPVPFTPKRDLSTALTDGFAGVRCKLPSAFQGNAWLRGARVLLT